MSFVDHVDVELVECATGLALQHADLHDLGLDVPDGRRDPGEGSRAIGQTDA